MTSGNSRDGRRIVCFDRYDDQSSVFYEMLRKLAEVRVVHDLQDFLNTFEDTSYTHGLLDTRSLSDSPTGLLSSLHEFRHRRPIGLMTDQGLETYISSLRSWGMLQCLSKDPNQFSKDLEHSLYMLEDPASGFGLLTYLGSTIEMYSLEINTMATKNRAIERVTNHFATCGFEVHELYDVRLILEELTNNALFHAFRNAAGEEKYSISGFKQLDHTETVRLEFGSDPDHVGFSVTDSAGSLPVETILGKIERQLNQEGLFDSSGRGLHLSQLLATRLVFNIERGKRTQIIAMFNDKRKSDHISPFMINFIGEDEFHAWGQDDELD